MVRSEKKIGEILIEEGLITLEQLEAALREQGRSKKFLGEILVAMQLIKEEDLYATLSRQYGIRLVSLKGNPLDWQFLKGFMPSLVLDYKCMPVERDEWSVTIAITNPLDVWMMQKAEEAARGVKVKFVLASLSDMEDAVVRYRLLLQQRLTDEG